MQIKCAVAGVAVKLDLGEWRVVHHHYNTSNETYRGLTRRVWAHVQARVMFGRCCDKGIAEVVQRHILQTK